MINTIIFDFGDVFINLDKNATPRALAALGLSAWNDELDQLNQQYELGKLTEIQFITGIQKHIPNSSFQEVREAWNAVLLDFPLYRLEFLQLLSTRYRLFLLSNTDATHIDRFQHKAGMSFYRDFYQCFEKIYFSFEMKMRKPDPEVYNYIIKKHDLSPKRTLFVDDKKENTDAAALLGLQTWNLQVGKEDVVELFKKLGL